MTARQSRLSIPHTPTDLDAAILAAPHLITEHFLGSKEFQPTLFGFMPEGAIIWFASPDSPISVDFLEAVRAAFLDHDVYRYIYVRHTTLTQQFPDNTAVEVFYVLAADEEGAAVTYFTVNRPAENVATLTAHETYYFPLDEGDGSPVSWLLNPDLSLARQTRTTPSTLC